MLQALISFGTFVGAVVLAFLGSFVVGFGLLAGAAAFVWVLFRLDDNGNTYTRPGNPPVSNNVVEMKPPTPNSNGSKPNA